MLRIGVDVGGTFTDLILSDDSDKEIHVYKVPSTVEDQSIGVINGIKELCNKYHIPPSKIDYVLHGTTVATNITIERNGATVGMLTTRNYRDILHIARHKKVENFSIQQSLPWQDHPLVKRRYRIPITEKLAAPDGRVRVPLNEDEVRQAVEKLKQSNVDVVIICFLFSFLNDVHERRAKEIVNEMWPEVQCFTSSEIIPQIREYERFSTTAMNGYVAPRVNSYLNHLSESLEGLGIRGKLHIMQSSGGMSTVEKATATPVTLLKSGPAGGVLAAAWWGQLESIPNLISVDIGGTSADISVIPDNIPKIVNPRDAEVNGYPVLTPMIDVETIGAGGGSIAYVDTGGAFRVGPKSAGANPGPACYGQGGENPCVTDANVILGRLDPEQFLGGDLKIYPELSYKAVEEKICSKLDMSVEEAALGILKIANNNMALAVRANSVRKGIDPREYGLFAAGGAGPLHAVGLAETIESTLVVVPNFPGITSAAGLLVGDLQYNYIKSHLVSLSDMSLETITEVESQFQELLNEARNQLLKDGIDPSNIVLERVVECRYVGQGYELRVNIPNEPLTPQSIETIITGFHEAHQAEYGHHFPNNEVEIITLRVIAIGKTPSLNLPELEQGGSVNPKEALLYEKETIFEIDGQLQRIVTPRYAREQLLAYDSITGPAIIIQRDSTTVIPPNWMATISPYGTLLAIPETAQKGAARYVQQLFSKVRN